MFFDRLTDDSVDDMSQVMSVWIEESIDNLKVIVRIYKIWT